MNMVQPTPRSFHEIFCAQYGVPLDLYGTTVLRLTLYPHARWLADLSAPGLLAADRSFIAAVGQLTRWRGFAGAVLDFQQLSGNRRFWRRGLRLRVSVARMRTLFSEVMGGTASTETADSRSPIEERTESDSFVTD